MPNMIILVSKEGDRFQITPEQAMNSGLLKRILLDNAVNCRRDLHSTFKQEQKAIACECYRCKFDQQNAIPVVNLDRISTPLLQKVCEFMAYKVKTNEMISSSISSTSVTKVRDLCNRIEGFSIGDQSSEILDLLVVADYLEI